MRVERGCGGGRGHGRAAGASPRRAVHRLAPSEDFHFSCLACELFVGGVYVRVFNRLKGSIGDRRPISVLRAAALVPLLTLGAGQPDLCRPERSALLAAVEEDDQMTRLAAFLNEARAEPALRNHLGSRSWPWAFCARHRTTWRRT